MTTKSTFEAEDRAIIAEARAIIAKARTLKFYIWNCDTETEENCADYDAPEELTTRDILTLVTEESNRKESAAKNFVRAAKIILPEYDWDEENYDEDNASLYAGAEEDNTACLRLEQDFLKGSGNIVGTTNWAKLHFAVNRKYYGSAVVKAATDEQIWLEIHGRTFIVPTRGGRHGVATYIQIQTQDGCFKNVVETATISTKKWTYDRWGKVQDLIKWIEMVC